jgi:pilus assembly protein CpaC
MNRRKALATLAAFLCAGVAAAQPATELRITVGKSVVIDYPADIRQISTSNPEIVDAVAVTTRELLLHGKGHGTATVIVWSKTGDRTFYNAIVEHNLDPIRRFLRETFPAEDIRVQSARDSVSLVGRVSSKEVSDRAAALVTPLAKSVINNLQIAPAAVDRQVLLRVKFAEVNRNAGSALGVNLLSTGLFNTPGRVTTGQFAAPSPGAFRAPYRAGSKELLPISASATRLTSSRSGRTSIWQR